MSGETGAFAGMAALQAPAGSYRCAFCGALEALLGISDCPKCKGRKPSAQLHGRHTMCSICYRQYGVLRAGGDAEEARVVRAYLPPSLRVKADLEIASTPEANRRRGRQPGPGGTSP